MQSYLLPTFPAFALVFFGDSVAETTCHTLVYHNYKVQSFRKRPAHRQAHIFMCAQGLLDISQTN